RRRSRAGGASRPLHGGDRALLVARAGAGPDPRRAAAERVAPGDDARGRRRRARRRSLGPRARAGAPARDPPHALAGPRPMSVEAARRAEAAPTDVAALAAGLVTVTAWGSAFVAIRGAGKALSPGSLALGRLLVSLVVLGVAAAVRREQLPGR